MKKVVATSLLVISALFVTVACGSQSDSPSGAVSAYVDAAQRKDIEAVKSHLSKGSLEMFGAVAKARGVAIEDLLMKEAAFAPEKIEIGREVIDGETATVEIRNSLTDRFDIKIPLVREDGRWKLARDVYTKQVIGK